MPKRSKAQEVSEKQAVRLRRERDLAVERYKGLTAFLENLTDDVRQPLQGMMGLVNLLNASGLNPHQSGYLEALSRSGRDLLGHIEDIRDLVRLQTGNLKLAPQRAALRPSFLPSQMSCNRLRRNGRAICKPGSIRLWKTCF